MFMSNVYYLDDMSIVIAVEEWHLEMSAAYFALSLLYALYPLVMRLHGHDRVHVVILI